LDIELVSRLDEGIEWACNDVIRKSFYELYQSFKISHAATYIMFLYIYPRTSDESVNFCSGGTHEIDFTNPNGRVI
jgi:hypothetical protein